MYGRCLALQAHCTGRSKPGVVCGWKFFWMVNAATGRSEQLRTDAHDAPERVPTGKLAYCRVVALLFPTGRRDRSPRVLLVWQFVWWYLECV